MSSLVIDVHALQDVPPSCLNRDDGGTPKTCQYGGVMRMRVSSQAWKKAMRDYAVAHYQKDDYGIRTKNVVDVIAGYVMKDPRWEGNADGARQLVRKAILESGAGLDFEKPKGKKEESDKLQALFFIGHDQAKAFADDVLRPDEDFVDTSRKNALYHDLDGGKSIDIASFGRMLASNPSLNVEGAISVQHAIGVSPVQIEYDYYIGTDDRSLEDHSGAEMLGDIQFDSGVVYRYASINMTTLTGNLDGDTETVRKAVEQMLSAFAYSIPSGKQHSFAGETLPDTLVIEIHDGRQRSLVSAFEDPVDPDGGIMSGARDRLNRYLERIDGMYGFDGVRLYSTMGDDPVPGGERVANVDDLIDRTVEAATHEDSGVVGHE